MSRHKDELDFARDDLMSHIHRCGVLQADVEQQAQWMNDTVEYLAERFPSLTQEQLDELRAIGERFCQPVIPHGKAHTALTLDNDDGSEQVEDAPIADAEAGNPAAAQTEPMVEAA